MNWLARMFGHTPRVNQDEELQRAHEREADLMRRVAVLRDEADLILRRKPIPWHRDEV